MYLKPCRRCPLKESCSKRRELASHLHSLNVTSAFYKCPEYTAQFPVGCTVTKSVLFGGPDWEMWEDVTCIVVAYHRDKFRLWPLNREGLKSEVFLPAYADELTKTNGNRHYEICPECYKPTELEAPKENWLCDSCGIPWASIPMPF